MRPCQSTQCSNTISLILARSEPLVSGQESYGGAICIADAQICPVQVPRVASWLLSEFHSCTCSQGKVSFLPPVARSFLVYTVGSKSNAGAGVSAIFPDFSRGGRLLSVASMFTNKLTAILYTNKVVFTLLQQFFTILGDSRSALSSSHTLVVAVREWLVILKHCGCRLFLLGPGSCGG